MCVVVVVEIAAPPSDAPSVVVYSRDQPQVMGRAPGNCKSKPKNEGFNHPGTHNVLPPVHRPRIYL